MMIKRKTDWLIVAGILFIILSFVTFMINSKTDLVLIFVIIGVLFWWIERISVYHKLDKS